MVPVGHRQMWWGARSVEVLGLMLQLKQLLGALLSTIGTLLRVSWQGNVVSVVD